jgi:hypothetical protein
MRRLRSALWMALLVALVLATTAQVMDIVVPSTCANLDPDGWLYWLLGCGKDSAGGGSGGAG